MFFVLLLILALVLAVDIFVSAAVIYHLRKYTLVGWTLPKIIVPAYFAFSLAIITLALIALFQITP